MPLVAHYPLYEDSGSTAHDVRGGNDGTTNGGVTQGANGILGTTAYDFDGADDYISADDSNDLDGFSSMSVSFWVYLDSFIDNAGLVGKDHNSSWQIWEDGSADNSGRSNVITFLWRDSGGSSDRIEGKTTPNTGEWIHFAFTHTGSEAAIYQNGVVDNDISTSVAPNGTDSNSLTIGYWDVGTYFDGRIADVRVYDHALSAAEVQYLYEVSDHGSQVSSVKSL